MAGTEFKEPNTFRAARVFNVPLDWPIHFHRRGLKAYGIKALILRCKGNRIIADETNLTVQPIQEDAMERVTQDVCKLNFPPGVYGRTLEEVERVCQAVIERIFRDRDGIDPLKAGGDYRNCPSRKFHLTPEAAEMDGLRREDDRETRSTRRLAVTHSVGKRSRVPHRCGSC